MTMKITAIVALLVMIVLLAGGALYLNSSHREATADAAAQSYYSSKPSDVQPAHDENWLQQAPDSKAPAVSRSVH